MLSFIFFIQLGTKIFVTLSIVKFLSELSQGAFFGSCANARQPHIQKCGKDINKSIKRCKKFYDSNRQRILENASCSSDYLVANRYVNKASNELNYLGYSSLYTKVGTKRKYRYLENSGIGLSLLVVSSFLYIFALDILDLTNAHVFINRRTWSTESTY